MNASPPNRQGTYRLAPEAGGARGCAARAPASNRPRRASGSTRRARATPCMPRRQAASRRRTLETPRIRCAPAALPAPRSPRLRRRRAACGCAPANDHAHNRRAVGVGRDIANGGPVDLQGVEREALQVAQAGVAGAEVIHREKKSALLECAERLNRPSGIAHQAALGDARVRSSTAGRPRRAMAAKRSARLTCANCRGETLTATRPIGSPASEASWTCRAPFPAPTRRPARCSRFHRAAE